MRLEQCTWHATSSFQSQGLRPLLNPDWPTIRNVRICKSLLFLLIFLLPTPSANRNEDHLLLAPSAFWKWRARIATHSVLDPRPKEYTPNTQYPNAWSTAYLCQKGHGPSNTSSYLFLNFTPISYFNSSLRVSGFQVVSITFATAEIPRS